MIKVIVLYLLTSLQVDTTNQDSAKTNVAPPIKTEVDGTSPETTSEEGSTTLPEESNEFTDSEAYRLLYEKEVNSVDRLITLIQFVIGLTVTIILAIIASQIFFNFRISVREVKQLKSEVDEKISLAQLDISKGLEAKHKDHKSDVSRLMTDIFKRHSDLTDAQRKVQEIQLAEEVKKLQSELKRLEVEVQSSKAELWQLKEVDSIALTALLDSIQLQIELGRNIKYDLDKVADILEKLGEIGENDLKKLEPILTKAKTSAKLPFARIMKMIKSMPVYKYVEGPPGLLGLVAGETKGWQKKYVKNDPSK